MWFLAIYVGLLFFIGFVATVVIALSGDAFDDEKLFFDKKNFFLCVFMYQSAIWNACEDVTITGKIILEILVTLFVLPLNIIIFVFLCLLELFILIVSCFMFIFGTEHKWIYLRQMREEYEAEQKLKSEYFEKIFNTNNLLEKVKKKNNNEKED